MPDQDSTLAPVRIIQPCSEGCACFRALPAGGWSDYGVCQNRRAPGYAYPALLGLECAHYQTEPASAQPAPETGPATRSS